MNEPGPVSIEERRATRPVFISYATADRKEALAICDAIERRGTQCWISTRDVPPGENYQEAIVRSLRDARGMILVFSEAANNSDEIKKELSLASRYHIPVMAVRIEDVEPSDAFAYELSTRQWIDAFESWEKSIDVLLRQIAQISSASPVAQPTASAPAPRKARIATRGMFIATAAVILIALAAGAWWFLRPGPAAPHSMMVRLTGFSNISTDLPATMPSAMRDEIIAAFNDDGVVGVSTAAAPPAGSAPAYALGGSIRRDGDKIKVNVSLTNERSGATLWSNIFSYDSDQVSRVPRHIAVDAGNMVRCGLFAASTYSKALPDPVLTDYMQYCHNSGLVQDEPGKDLDLAQKGRRGRARFLVGLVSGRERRDRRQLRGSARAARGGLSPASGRSCRQGNRARQEQQRSARRESLPGRTWRYRGSRGMVGESPGRATARVRLRASSLRRIASDGRP